MKLIHALVAVVLALTGLSQAVGQDLPKSQPKYLTIFREQVKVGQAAAHAKFEEGYPAALAKAKSPDYYLALTSLTGPSEAWYVQPAESFAAIGETMKREDQDPVLAKELSRLAEGDAKYISGSRIIRAMAKPELSAGAFPDLSKARFFKIITFYVRPGRERQFEETAKAYAAIMSKTPKVSYRVYEVLAGERQPTYLAFESVETFAEIDQRMAAAEAAFKKAAPEQLAHFEKFSEVAVSIDSNEFRVDPKQSYVSKETREKDPKFWMAK